MAELGSRKNKREEVLLAKPELLINTPSKGMVGGKFARHFAMATGIIGAPYRGMCQTLVNHSFHDHGSRLGEGSLFSCLWNGRLASPLIAEIVGQRCVSSAQWPSQKETFYVASRSGWLYL